jgi:predicted NBD/HSP70 family sugar kinase
MKTPYGLQRDARRKNASALLFDLWYHAPLSRAALAKRNNLTRATVSAICDDLAALNLICEVGQDRDKIGRPANLLELNPKARGAVGLEISTNYVAVLLTDFCGGPVWRDVATIPIGAPSDVTLGRSQMLLAAAIEQAQQNALPLLGIGVAVPGIVDTARGMVIQAPALGWKDLALKSLWEAHFGLPVIVENKARAAAIAEMLHGAARAVQNFIYVSIGTDVRSSVDVAVVINGVPYRGAHGLAVDAGHMILDPDGEPCSCGLRGCWQAQADVGREAALALARLADGEPSVLREKTPEAIQDHRTIHQAALERDALALEVFRTVVTLNHARAILNLILLFDPELVLIGFANVGLPSEFQERMKALGRMADTNIAKEVRRQMHVRALPPPVIRSASREPDTIMLGAASLLIDAFLREPPLVEA